MLGDAPRRNGIIPRAETDSSDDCTKTADQVSEEDQKVIVRSNGTVELRGQGHRLPACGSSDCWARDFDYRKFHRYPNGQRLLDLNHINRKSKKTIHTSAAWPKNYNVIDARQSEAQNTVIEALRGLGHGESADHYTHFSYEMVALSPRCARRTRLQRSARKTKRGPTSRSAAARALA